MILENITTFNFEQLNKFNKIFVLVSGGIDSTYLYEYCKQNLPEDKIYPVNAFNPFERNNALKIISEDTNFIEIKNVKQLDYSDILKQSFLRLPKAREDKKNKKYHKKIFPCCRYIKHHAFLKHFLFKQENTVVLSGIKKRDGFQRAMFLMSLVDGKERARGVIIKDFPAFYHLHKTGQLYCYPFRDYDKRYLPNNIINQLREKYVDLMPSGCCVCPVLVLFRNRIRKSKFKHDIQRLQISLKYAEKLGVL